MRRNVWRMLGVEKFKLVEEDRVWRYVCTSSIMQQKGKTGLNMKMPTDNFNLKQLHTVIGIQSLRLDQKHSRQRYCACLSASVIPSATKLVRSVP